MHRMLAYQKRLLLATLAATSMIAGNAIAAGAKDHVNSKHWTNKYDHHFQKYSKRYFGPNFDWKWFKAQAIAESGLNPKATSHVGAKGLMQIMPATYAEIRKANPYFSHINDPRWNVAAGIYYNRYLYTAWPEIPDSDRLLFTFGSYNAGLGGMIRAYKRSGRRARKWTQIAPYAPNETKKYVQRIRELRNREATIQSVPRRFRLKMLRETPLGGVNQSS